MGILQVVLQQEIEFKTLDIECVIESLNSKKDIYDRRLKESLMRKTKRLKNVNIEKSGNWLRCHFLYWFLLITSVSFSLSPSCWNVFETRYQMKLFLTLEFRSE